MNQRLMKYLSALGYNQTCLDERARAYLLGAVTGSSILDNVNDLWMRLGAQLGIPGTINAVQMRWADDAEPTPYSTWNDAMANLPDISPNLLKNQDFLGGVLNWVLGTGWTVVGSTAVKSVGVASALSQALTIEAGATYRVSYDILVVAGQFNSSVGGSNGVAVTASGTYSQDLTTINSTSFAINASALGIGTVSNLSIKRLGV